jgi:glucokinase
MSQSPIFAGIDLGGTKIAAVLQHDDSYETRRQLTSPTEAHEGPRKVVDRIAQVVQQVCSDAGYSPHSLGGIGVGVPAVIDYDAGHTLLMPNLPGDWKGFPVAAILTEKLGCPVWLVNDARAFALAEATYGAGQGASVVACFTVGTGVGGGLVISGKLHMGLQGSAGEFGHQTIVAQGPLCGCGNHGCLETLASGPAIAAAGVKAVLQGLNSEIGVLVDHDITRITPAIVKTAAERGDLIAREILEQAGEYLGIGISNVITLFAPNRVIIGGGVAALGDWIFAPIRATVLNRCKTVPVDQIAILPAALGQYAGAIGAFIWSRQRHAHNQQV